MGRRGSNSRPILRPRGVSIPTIPEVRYRLTSSRIKLLCQEFPSVPSTYIRQVLAEKRKFRATYLALEAQERAPEGDNLPYTRLKHPRRPNKNHPTKHATANPFFENSPLADSLRRELNAAKRQARREAGKYTAADDGCMLIDKRNASRRKSRLKRRDTTRRNTLATAPLWNVSVVIWKVPRTESSLARARRRISSATSAFVRQQRHRLGSCNTTYRASTPMAAELGLAGVI